MAAASTAVAAPRQRAVSPVLGRLAIRVGTGVILLLLWEGLAHWFAASYVARPSGIIRAIPRVFEGKQSLIAASAGPFWPSVGWTMLLAFTGLAVGVVSGVLVGLTMGRLRDADAALKLYVSAFFALPTIAIAPLMGLWFGQTGTAEFVIVSFGAFMPVCLNVYDGVRRLPIEYVEVAKTYHARWWNVWFGIALPASLPYLLAGLRLAFGRALVGAVVAEYLFSLKPRLGFWILTTSRVFDQNGSMVGVFVLMVIAVSMNASIDLAARKLLPWFRRPQ